jgi:prophage regulatory protein
MVRRYKADTLSDSLKLIRQKDLLQAIPISQTTLYDEISKGRFPQPIKIGSRATAWFENEIDAWLADRVSQRALKSK